MRRKLNNIYILGLCFTTMTHASTPVFTIIPCAGSGNTIQLNSGESATICYTVTNNSPSTTHTIGLKSTSGLTQIALPIGGMQNCYDSTVLPPKASCALTLLAVASDIHKHDLGPIICANSPFLCNQPSTANRLTVQVTNTPSINLQSSVHALALSVKDEETNKALTGKTRTFTINNPSDNTISDITYTLNPALPSDASITYTPSDCTTLSPGDSCTIAITPGATATASPSILTAQTTSSAAILPIPINILTYGSIYQGGYLFSMDDTTATTGSVGGTAAALTDQALTWPLGVVWSANGNTFTGEYATCVASCDEVQYPFTGGTMPISPSNGTDNSQTIINFYNNYYTSQSGTSVPSGSCNNSFPPTCPPPGYSTICSVNPNNCITTAVPTESYAAGVCKGNINDYADWYLPAICEMGYNLIGAPNNSGCNYQIDPAMQNIQSNLINTGIINMNGLYWSSTQCFDSNVCSTSLDAWYQVFDSVTGSLVSQNFDNKKDPSGVRCVRALTQP